MSRRGPTRRCDRSYGLGVIVTRFCSIAAHPAILSFCALCSAARDAPIGTQPRPIRARLRTTIEQQLWRLTQPRRKERCPSGKSNGQDGCQRRWFIATRPGIPLPVGPWHRYRPAAHRVTGRHVGVHGLGRSAIGVLGGQFTAVGVFATGPGILGNHFTRGIEVGAGRRIQPSTRYHTGCQNASGFRCTSTGTGC
jgi:hypothetical protein